MKTKKFTKKLSLNKSIIVVLQDIEKAAVKGGYRPTEIYENCKTWHPVCRTLPDFACPY